MPIADLLVDCGPHALHSLDPQGGVSLGTMMQTYGDRVALIGNVNCGLLQTGTDEECRADVLRSLHEGMQNGGGYLFSTSNCIYTGLPLSRHELMLSLWETVRELVTEPVIERKTGRSRPVFEYSRQPCIKTENGLREERCFMTIQEHTAINRDKEIVQNLPGRCWISLSSGNQPKEEGQACAVNDLHTGLRPGMYGWNEIPWHEMDIDCKLVLHCTDPFAREMEQISGDPVPLGVFPG